MDTRIPHFLCVCANLCTFQTLWSKPYERLSRELELCGFGSDSDYDARALTVGFNVGKWVDFVGGVGVVFKF